MYVAKQQGHITEDKAEILFGRKEKNTEIMALTEKSGTFRQSAQKQNNIHYPYAGFRAYATSICGGQQFHAQRQ